MNIPIFLVSIEDKSYSTVKVNIKIGQKDYCIYLGAKKDDTNQVIGWELSKYCDANNTFINDVANFKAVGLTVEPLDTIFPAIEKRIKEIIEKDRIDNQRKNDEENAKKEQRRLAFEKKIASSAEYSNIYTFKVEIYWEGLNVVIYHPKEQNVKIEINYSVDKDRWHADYTRPSSIHSDRYRYGNKVNVKNFFGTVMQAFIKNELEEQYRKHILKNKSNVIKAWFKANKDVLVSHGFNTPSEYEDNAHSMWRKLNDDNNIIQTITMDIADTGKIIIKEVKTVNTTIVKMDPEGSDVLINGILTVKQ